MSRPLAALVSILALLGLEAGCSTPQQTAPSAASGGGIGVSGKTSASPAADASAKAPSGDDGGNASGSGALPIECKNVPSVKFIGEDTPPGQFLNAITAPADFNATRIVATWEDDCAHPTIRLEMSDGACPDGKGHLLRFLFDANAIAAGVIRLGQNTIAPDPDGIPIRYLRPLTIDPRGTWGTCAGASGTLDFVGELATRLGATLEGRFELELTSCDDSKQPLQTVAGTFSGPLRRGLTDVCPAK